MANKVISDTLQVTLAQRFKRACTKLDISPKDAPDYLIDNASTKKPYSYRSVFEAIKYPEKNQELHNSVIEFCDTVESKKVKYMEQ